MQDPPIPPLQGNPSGLGDPMPQYTHTPSQIATEFEAAIESEKDALFRLTLTDKVQTLTGGPNAQLSTLFKLDAQGVMIGIQSGQVGPLIERSRLATQELIIKVGEFRALIEGKVVDFVLEQVADTSLEELGLLPKNTDDLSPTWRAINAWTPLPLRVGIMPTTVEAPSGDVPPSPP